MFATVFARRTRRAFTRRVRAFFGFLRYIHVFSLSFIHALECLDAGLPKTTLRIRSIQSAYRTFEAKHLDANESKNN